MRHVLMIVCGLLALGLVASASTVIVDAAEHVVVTRFGRPTAAHSEPGLRLKWPAPIERVARFDKRLLYLTTPEAEFLTADKKNVVVAAYATWSIVDPVRYLSALRTREVAQTRLSALVVSALGSAVGGKAFADFVSDTGLDYARATAAGSPGDPSAGGGLVELEGAALASVRPVALADFGIQVDQIGVTRFVFPEQNLPSVFSRMRAERERIAKGFRAEGESEAQQIIAEANLRSADITTEAEAEAARTIGRAEAEAARIYAEAYSGHEDFYRFLRTLETYEAIFDKDTTLLLSGDDPLFELLTRDGHEVPLSERFAEASGDPR